MNFWVLLSIAAMAANAGKVLAVRRLCGGIDSRFLVFLSRAGAAAVLMPILLASEFAVPRSWVFWGVTLVTAVLTAVASVLLTEAIKKGQLASVMPMQATVPVFMAAVLMIGFDERPGIESLAWIMATVVCLGLTLYFGAAQKAARPSKTVIFTVFSLTAAVIFGLTTVLDRVAIQAAAGGALAYSGCWNLASAVILAIECGRSNTGRRLKKADLLPAAVFCGAALAAFYSQQLAVELSASIPGAVVNVKTIVMLHLPVVIMTNFIVFNDKCSKKLLIFGLLTIICGIGMINSL